MTSRWSSIAVCLLWAITMGWLVEEKVLPPLLLGDPPSYRSIAAARDQAPVGWKLFVNGKPVGSASSVAVELPGEVTEVQTRVHFDYLPVEELVPTLLRQMVGPAVAQRSDKLAMDSESILDIDAEGRLVRFSSALRVPSLGNVVQFSGKLEDGQLKLTITSGNFSYPTEAYLPPKSLAGDMLSPQACLPGLRQGQTWTVPSYNPFRPVKAPMEILKATVERTERIDWNGRGEDVWLVVYRADPGLGIGTGTAPRGRLWVRRDGTVLRQQVLLFGCTLTFVRLPPGKAAALEKPLQRP